MNLLAIKVLSGVAAVGAVSGGGYLLFNSNKNVSKPSQIVYLVTTTSSSVTESSFKCQVTGDSSKVDDSCVVKKLSLPANHKKHIDLGTLNGSEWVDLNNTTTGGTSTTKEYLKVEVNQAVYDALTGTDSKTLDIIKKIGNVNVISAAVPLFSFKDNVSTTKTSYAVAKVSDFLDSSKQTVSESGPITISNTTSKCAFTSETGDGLDCEVYKFSDSQTNPANLSIVDFSTDTNKLGSITKGSYYLFKFTSEKKLPSDFLSSGTVDVLITLQSPTGTSSSIKYLKVTELKPAFREETTPEIIFLTSGTATK